MLFLFFFFDRHNMLFLVFTCQMLSVSLFTCVSVCISFFFFSYLPLSVCRQQHSYSSQRLWLASLLRLWGHVHNPPREPAFLSHRNKTFTLSSAFHSFYVKKTTHGCVVELQWNWREKKKYTQTWRAMRSSKILVLEILLWPSLLETTAPMSFLLSSLLREARRCSSSSLPFQFQFHFLFLCW